MFFTFKSSKYYSHPHTIVPEQFGGDGVSTISQQINMTAEEEVAAIIEFNTNTTRQLRQNEYPPIEDYIDGVVKGDQAQIDEYINKCIAIKQKYPKPE
jgi:hypothetical protein